MSCECECWENAGFLSLYSIDFQCPLKMVQFNHFASRKFFYEDGLQKFVHDQKN